MIRILAGAALLIGAFYFMRVFTPAETPPASTVQEHAPLSPADAESEAAVSAVVFSKTGPAAFNEDRFANAGTAQERAQLINAAIALDDPQLLRRAETLALEMIDQGSAADVLAVLPLIPYLREQPVPQESLCRLKDGLGFEVVKLKYDRTYPERRPWNTVCKSS